MSVGEIAGITSLSIIGLYCLYWLRMNIWPPEG